MKRKLCSVICMALAISMTTLRSAAQDGSTKALKQQERYTLSLELEFSKKDRNSLERAISILFDVGPNG